MIEAVVSFGLIALGVGAWLFVRMARGFYRRRGQVRDDSFLARLFTEESQGGPDA